MSDDRELSDLYRSADQPQPPAALDETIRGVAHRAVKRKRSHAPQWLGGIAASFIAALLITQLLPTAQQEADIAPGLHDAPRPATQAIAPGRIRTEDAAAPATTPAAQKKSTAERARAGNQVMQEKAELKQDQESDRAFPLDEYDAVLSAEPVEQEIRALAIPKAAPVPPETVLQTIIDLLDAGKTVEARQQLDDFRIRYPGVEIPASITRRLEPGIPR